MRAYNLLYSGSIASTGPCIKKVGYDNVVMGKSSSVEVTGRHVKGSEDFHSLLQNLQDNVDTHPGSPPDSGSADPNQGGEPDSDIRTPNFKKTQGSKEALYVVTLIMCAVGTILYVKHLLDNNLVCSGDSRSLALSNTEYATEIIFRGDFSDDGIYCSDWNLHNAYVTHYDGIESQSDYCLFMDSTAHFFRAVGYLPVGNRNKGLRIYPHNGAAVGKIIIQTDEVLEIGNDQLALKWCPETGHGVTLFFAVEEEQIWQFEDNGRRLVGRTEGTGLVGVGRRRTSILESLLSHLDAAVSDGTDRLLRAGDRGYIFASAVFLHYVQNPEQMTAIWNTIAAAFTVASGMGVSWETANIVFPVVGFTASAVRFYVNNEEIDANVVDDLERAWRENKYNLYNNVITTTGILILNLVFQSLIDGATDPPGDRRSLRDYTTVDYRGYELSGRPYAIIPTIAGYTVTIEVDKTRAHRNYKIDPLCV